METVMLNTLGKLQELKRIAIPQTYPSSVYPFADALNLSEIIVYEPKHAEFYDRFEEVDEAYAAGIQFNIELVDITDIDLSLSCYATPGFKGLLEATDEVLDYMADDEKPYWDLHTVQPIIKLMILELQEVKR
jgi:hypothetical protein